MISGLSGYLKGVKKAIGNIGHGNQPTTPTLGRMRIGNREIEEIKLISQGGYAYVFKVRDTLSGEIFALKKMICQSPERLNTAKNEINMLRSLPRHPNLLEVFDSYVEQRDHCYYVYVLLEFCADGSIFDLMEKYESTRLGEKQIIFIMREVCEGVKVLHSMKPPIAHRDLKIENVLLSNKKFKLCDFGSCSRSFVDFAKVPQSQYHDYEEEYDKNTTLMYRPPEMCDPYQKQIVCEKVDIWMLGCILYTMCFYKHPFQEMTKLSIVNAAYSFPAEHPYPQKMIDLIRLLLTPNPKTRPSIYEVCDLLASYFSINAVKLNPDAIKVREEQKKQAMEISKFENNSSRKFNGDIPEDELFKLQQKLARGDDYGYDEQSPVNNYSHKLQINKQSSHDSLKTQQKSNFNDFGSFGPQSTKNSKVETQHFNSSPGLGQGNDWYDFGNSTSKSTSNQHQTQQRQNNHQTNNPSSFGQPVSRNNNQTQQVNADPKVNEQWKNFDFNSVTQNQKPNNNNWNTNNNTNNKTGQGFNANNWGGPQQVQSTTNRTMPQQMNIQNMYQQSNVQGWNQNINQGQFPGNRNMQQQPQGNFQGFNQNMNQGNNAWNSFGNVPQNNLNMNNNVGFNNTGGQQQIRNTTVTDNLLDLADTKPVKLDTASGIMSLYGKK